MVIGGIAPLDAFNDTATLGSFGFIAIYVFVALGAPLYLRRLGELRPYHVAISAFTLGLLLIPAVGSVYPVPAPPTNTFPYIFAAYFVLGIALLWSQTRGNAQVRESSRWRKAALRWSLAALEFLRLLLQRPGCAVALAVPATRDPFPCYSRCKARAG
jgi:amino acid transporter